MIDHSSQQGVQQHTQLSKTKLLMKILFMTLGASLVAVGLEIFLVPNKIIDGGIVGISIIASALSSLPLGVYLVLFNLPFLYLGYKQIGKTFAFSTLFSVIIMSIGTSLLHPVAPLTIDPLLASVFGGIIIGVGVGLVIRSGGSLDGTEIVAILVSKKARSQLAKLSCSLTYLYWQVRALYSDGIMQCIP